MPIKVRIHNASTGQDSDPLLDAGNVLHDVLPDSEDPAFPLLARIDWYDTTTFKHDEMPDLIREIDALLGQTERLDARTYLTRLRTLAGECEVDQRCGLKFIGD